MGNSKKQSQGEFFQASIRRYLFRADDLRVLLSGVGSLVGEIKSSHYGKEETYKFTDESKLRVLYYRDKVAASILANDSDH